MPGDPPGHARVGALRILLVSQMYPGPSDPDLGIFVANLERELLARGHEIERAVVDRRGGSRLQAPRSRPRRPPRGETLPAGRRLRALPRAGRARCGARDARAARGHRARAGRRQRRGRAPGARAATSLRGTPGRGGRRRLAVAARSARRRASRRRSARSRWSTAASTSSGSGRGLQTKPATELGVETDGTVFLCLGSLSERKNVVAPRPRLRALTGRAGSRSSARAAACRTRAPGSNPARGPRRPRSRSRVDRRVRRPLPAEPRGAVRAGHPRSDGLRALGRGDEGRRAAGVRHGEGRRPRRPHGRRRARPSARTAAALPRPNLAGREAAGAHDVKRQAERVEEILLRAAAGRRA